MEFELQYELDNFKEIQDQYFDKDNKCYTGVNLSTDIMEKMLSLIDNLSERVNELEPVIKQQIKKSLPIHGVGWRSELLPDFDVQEINEILQDCKEKEEDLQALVCRIWNKGYMTAVADEREG